MAASVTKFKEVMCHSGAVAKTEAASMQAASIDVRVSDNEDIEPISSGREARNMAEKQRRDKLNASIQELGGMVPRFNDSSGRKLDKTGILRYATHGLRLNHVYGNAYLTQRKNLHAKATSIDETEINILMSMLDRFFISVTCNGQIVLISSSVQQLLGHNQPDLYGQSIYQITHPDDHLKLRQELVPSDIKSLLSSFNCQSISSYLNWNQLQNQYQHQNHTDNSDDNPNDSDKINQKFAAIDKQLQSDRRCFTVRLARVCARSEAFSNYELVKIDGCFRRSDALAAGKICDTPIVPQMIRRSRNNASSTVLNGSSAMGPPQHDAFTEAAMHGISGNDIVFVGLASLVQKTINLSRDPSAYCLEYRTRHLVDGQIVDCDQRIGIVAGYLKDEVTYLSPFSFMHQDDVRWAILALRQMYDQNSNYGESFFRLLTRSGNFIYLHTRGYLEIDKETNKVHSFICINTLLDDEEGKRRVQQMKDMYSTMINADIPRNTNYDAPASCDPQQLERIVFFLIEDLQKTNAGDTDSNIDIDSKKPLKIEGKKSDSMTPPLLQLAIIPPEVSSIKSSISKSVNVVNVAAAANGQLMPEKTEEEQDEDSILKRHLRTTSAATAKNNTLFATALSTPPMSPIECAIDAGTGNILKDNFLQKTTPVFIPNMSILDEDTLTAAATAADDLLHFEQQQDTTNLIMTPLTIESKTDNWQQFDNTASSSEFHAMDIPVDSIDEYDITAKAVSLIPLNGDDDIVDDYITPLQLPLNTVTCQALKEYQTIMLHFQDNFNETEQEPREQYQLQLQLQQQQPQQQQQEQQQQQYHQQSTMQNKQIQSNCTFFTLTKSQAQNIIIINK